MLTFPKYELYRNSGEDWLGEVPNHWKVIRIKHLFTELDNRSLNGIETLLSLRMNEGLVPHNDVSDKLIHDSVLVGYKRVEPGQLVMNRMRAAIGLFGVAIIPGIVSPDYAIFHRIKELLVNYYLYLFKTQLMKEIFFLESKGIGTGSSGFLRLYSDRFGQIKVPFPPIDEQKRIVEFLDRKTSEIDQAIAQKERLIELLQEQKAILINQAVTKGLNPNSPMRYSGIDWIGNIPENWIVCRVKHVVKTITKGTTPSTEGKGFSDAGIRYFKAENIVDNRINLEPEYFIDEKTDYALRRSRLQEGDVLFVIAGATIGKTTVVGANHVPSNTNQAVSLIRPSNAIRSEFLHLWLQSNYVENLLRVSSVQSAQPNIAMEDLGNIKIPLPDLEEQDKIIDTVSKFSESFLEILEKQTIEIKKLIELKSVFISSAVTGKIKV
jgi:type I restriction enzyme S subunit